jgi:hypothetical protein
MTIQQLYQYAIQLVNAGVWTFDETTTDLYAPGHRRTGVSGVLSRNLVPESYSIERSIPLQSVTIVSGGQANRIDNVLDLLTSAEFTRRSGLRVDQLRGQEAIENFLKNSTLESVFLDTWRIVRIRFMRTSSFPSQNEQKRAAGAVEGADLIYRVTFVGAPGSSAELWMELSSRDSISGCRVPALQSSQFSGQVSTGIVCSVDLKIGSFITQVIKPLVMQGTWTQSQSTRVINREIRPLLTFEPKKSIDAVPLGYAQDPDVGLDVSTDNSLTVTGGGLWITKVRLFDSEQGTDRDDLWEITIDRTNSPLIPPGGGSWFQRVARSVEAALVVYGTRDMTIRSACSLGAPTFEQRYVISQQSARQSRAAAAAQQPQQPQQPRQPPQAPPLQQATQTPPQAPPVAPSQPQQRVRPQPPPQRVPPPGRRPPAAAPRALV